MTLEQALRENEALRAENAQLHKRLAEVEKLVQTLQEQLLEAQRAAKRQAAPFSKGEPEAHPKKPGRKRKHKGTFREVPQQVDVVKEARLPEACPECGGAVSEERVDAQYQIDIPRVKPKTTQFNVHVGQCIACGCRLQGRHPEQTSNALGRAAVQIGPRALSLAAEAKHLLGVPYGKIAHFFQKAFGLRVNRSTLARADQRVAQAHHASYAQIQQVVQASPATHVDETGWKVAGRLAWLWTAATRQATLYLIHRRRGHEFKTQALLSTDLNLKPKQILQWFILRWRLEVTFREAREHLGMETQRQWSDKAILRTTPALLALFSLVTLIAHQHAKRRKKFPMRQTAWYHKPKPTFSDALALVRAQIWTQEVFPTCASASDGQKPLGELPSRLFSALCYST